MELDEFNFFTKKMAKKIVALFEDDYDKRLLICAIWTALKASIKVMLEKDEKKIVIDKIIEELERMKGEE